MRTREANKVEKRVDGMILPTEALPVCGKVKVNGWEGDAVFRTGQSFSTITRRLARVGQRKQGPGAVESNMPGSMGIGKELQVTRMVLAYVQMPGSRIVMEVPMRILEESAESIEAPLRYKEKGETRYNQAIYEVIFGMDFLCRFESMSLQRTKEIKLDREGISYVIAPPMFQMEKFKKDYRTSNYAQDLDARVIVLIDIDSFAVQVYDKDGKYAGEPRVVANSKHRIVAVSSEAKQFGIGRKTTKHVWDAERLCSELRVIKIPDRPGSNRPSQILEKFATEEIVTAIKATLFNYGMIEEKDYVFQLSSPDEFFIDITNHVDKLMRSETGYSNWIRRNFCEIEANLYFYGDDIQGKPDPQRWLRKNAIRRLPKKDFDAFPLDFFDHQEKRLLYGAILADKVVKGVKQHTGYQSSAGIGSKKLIAKIASGLHKPKAITVVTPGGFTNFTQEAKIEDVWGLGGDLGSHLKTAFPSVHTMEDFLEQITWEKLRNCIQGLNGGNHGDAVQQATDIMNRMAGVCDFIVEPTEFFRTCSTKLQFFDAERKMNRKKITRNVVKACEDLLHEKIIFEHLLYYRQIKKLKISMSIGRGASVVCLLDNPVFFTRLYTKIYRLLRRTELDGEDISSLIAPFMAKTLLANCRPDKRYWNGTMRVNEIKLTGEFPSVY